ncbi:ferredoxin reductase [Alteromonas sp. KC3]|nr:ferredoxin reductase [Alteromonas sp. KC3]BCO22793.1 ferredoxin reductase [Alteromonas sp. KC14]
MVTIVSEQIQSQPVCIVVGASHAGVNCAFELRKQGFSGRLVLIDADMHLPYHRPPLSKAFLNTPLDDAPAPLKAKSAYEQADIELFLGAMVTKVDAKENIVSFNKGGSGNAENGYSIKYTHLVFATGASPIIPPIPGLNVAENCLVMRNAKDALALKSLMHAKRENISNLNIVIVGAGYIGLEAAASLRKAGASVTVIEREERILARVASESVSNHVARIHQENGATILCQRNVSAVERDTDKGFQWIVCDNGERYRADAILLGVGVRVNSELAQEAGTSLHRGAISVNTHMQTSIKNIWAIGDCTSFTHPLYGENSHIESVQNALEQAKVAAKNIQQISVADAGDAAPLQNYKAIPWFWSDQYNMKLQMVGLPVNADCQVTRQESKEALSVWHFVQNKLVSVEAINSPKSYVLGGRAIDKNAFIDKSKLADPSQSLADLL